MPSYTNKAINTNEMQKWRKALEPESLSQLTNLVNQKANQSDLNITNTNVNSVTSQVADIVTVNIRSKGAKLDGITDDSEILQQWIDTLSTQSFGSLQGGVILIPGDMLVTHTVNLKSNVHLIGSGYNISRIRTNAGFSGNSNNVLQAQDQTNIRIANLRIQGTGYGAGGSSFNPIGSFTGAGSCIVMGGCSNIVIENCYLYNGGGYNDSEGVGNVWLSCCKNAKIINNIIEKSDNSICVDMWYSNYNADGVDRSGIYNDNVIISGNTCFNGSGRGVVMENINGYGSIAVVGNTFTSLQYAGVEGRNFTNCVITGNSFEGSPMLKTFGDTTSNMQYGVCVENFGIKCVISNNNFQNIRTHGIQLLNADEFVITGNRISNVLNNDGIFIKNVSSSTTWTASTSYTSGTSTVLPTTSNGFYYTCTSSGTSGTNQPIWPTTLGATVTDGSIVWQALALNNLNSGVISSNLLINVDTGIYIKKDSTDGSTMKNVVVSNNNIMFRTSGIDLEYVKWFSVNGNILTPKTAFGTSIGMNLIHTYRSQFKNNEMAQCNVGVQVSTDDSSIMDNYFDTCTTSLSLTSCSNTMTRDVIRGGTTGINSVSGNTNIVGKQVLFSGSITTPYTGTGLVMS